jgi:flagellar motor protein MotB
MRGDSVSAGYRRGLVLGLTLAELMLLLVFCLLIAVSAVIAAGRQKLVAAETAARTAVQRAEAAETVLAEMARPQRTAAPGSPAEAGRIDDTWRRLVEGGALVEDVARAGLGPEVLRENREFLAKVVPLAEKATPEELAEALTYARKVRADLGLTPDAPAEMVGALVASARSDAEAARRRADLLAAEVETLGDALEARSGRRVDLPPIITLREEGGFYFETGSAVPSPEFAERLHDETAAELARLIATYDVDVIEVIGHTDERRVVASRFSNLDDTLAGAVRGGPVEAMVPADNAGLGIARAVAVAQILKSDARLAGHEILPLSAAQLVGTDGRMATGSEIGDVRERRRIEIRLRRAAETQ